MHISASPAEPVIAAAAPLPSVTLEKTVDRPAFFAAPGIGSAIQSAGELKIRFAYSGKSITLAAGRTVWLYQAEAWRGDDRMVIVVENVWGTPDYQLTAVREDDVEMLGLKSFVLGGFRLDASSAVLADSFWDIADRDAETIETSNFERLVELFVTNKRQGYSTDLDDIAAHDLADPVTLKLVPKARREADRRLAARDVADDAVAYDRVGRVERLANLLAGYLSPDGEGWDVARRSGYSSRELGDLWADVQRRVGEIVSAPVARAN